MCAFDGEAKIFREKWIHYSWRRMGNEKGLTGKPVKPLFINGAAD